MRAKRIVLRALAQRDVEDIIAYYLDQGASDAALGFIDVLESAYAQISRQPGTGSPRYGHELSLPGLRALRLARYPYLIFYLERPDHIDVWRVLHGQRDIPAWMQEPSTR